MPACWASPRNATASRPAGKFDPHIHAAARNLPGAVGEIPAAGLIQRAQFFLRGRDHDVLMPRQLARLRETQQKRLRKMIRMQIRELFEFGGARDHGPRRDDPAHPNARETRFWKSCPAESRWDPAASGGAGTCRRVGQFAVNIVFDHDRAGRARHRCRSRRDAPPESWRRSDSEMTALPPAPSRPHRTRVRSEYRSMPSASAGTPISSAPASRTGSSARDRRALQAPLSRPARTSARRSRSSACWQPLVMRMSSESRAIPFCIAASSR